LKNAAFWPARDEEVPVDLLVGLIGALVGVAAGGFSTLLTGRAQLRRELEFAHDRELRTRRLEPYMSLYRRTKSLPRYWRTAPARAELSAWSEGLHEWYFDEAGGLFLSDDARVAYLNVLEVIAVTANAGKLDDPLSDEDMQRLWRAGQTLRRQLAADIGAANAPRLPSRQPVISPPATARFADPPMTTPAD
jgi:hypothetical protein